MSIRFRFRSSVNFDSVDTGGRASISVRELRAMIILLKKLNSCQNFDLELSDAVSGQEFGDDNFQIPSGASVIVKRVPAKKLLSDVTPLDAVENVRMKGSHSQTLSDLLDEFDNFGACPIPATLSPDTAVEFTKKPESTGRGNIQEGLRPVSPKIQSSDTKPDVPTGLNFGANEGKPVEEEKVKEHLNSVRMLGRDHEALQISNLPAEMKCPLCRTYFKEAVMIPCCQRSFCDNCISQALTDKRRCPECFSDKCKVGDLLPNLSLRKAIEHFLLESEMLIFDSESALRKDAPDEESGIQAIDISCPVGRKAHSPSATGQGSNQVILTQNAPLGFPQSNLYDEADSTIKGKKELWVKTGGGERNFVASVGYNKVMRTCYMCGSPDHLIRDCPVAHGAYQVPQTGPGVIQGGIPGYATSYWNGASFPSIEPFPNIYTSPGMMPFHAPPFPMTPYGAPPVVPSLYNGLSPPGGIMGIRTMEHREGDRVERRPLGHSELSGEERRKPSKEVFLRGHDGEDISFHERYLYREPERSPQHKFHKEKESSRGQYEDIYARKFHKQQLSKNVDSDACSREAKRERSSRSAGRDRTPDSIERLDFSTEFLRNSSDRYSEDRYKHHRRSSRKRHTGRGQSGSDSSRGVSDKSERDHDRRSTHDKVSRRKHDSRREAGYAQNLPGDQRRHDKERDSGSQPKHPRPGTKRTSEDMYENRLHMTSTVEEDRKDVQDRQRQRRVH